MGVSLPHRDRGVAWISSRQSSSPISLSSAREAKFQITQCPRPQRVRTEVCAAIIVFGLVSFAAFYNLGLNPSTWRDEGGTLLLARTVAEDGVYAVKNSDHYDAFGPVQSVGPTVILPIAAIFRFRGIGLSQGRLIPAVYLLVAVVVFYFAARLLLGWQAGMIAVLLILSSPTVELVYWGRQALGELPGLGFFIAAWLLWALSLRNRKAWLWPIAGLLVGAAAITKIQFGIIGISALLLVSAADYYWYRQGAYKSLLWIAAVAVSITAVWWVWQLAYLGRAEFVENAGKLRHLSAVTCGLDRHMTVEALKELFGPPLGYFYFFWGVPALIYAGICSLRRTQQALLTCSLLSFTLLWLGYWLFWITPWKQYGFPAFAVCAVFVTQLWAAILRVTQLSTKALVEEFRRKSPGPATVGLASVAMLVTCLACSLIWTLHNEVIKNKQTVVLSTAAYLEAHVPRSSLIETWDRELALMTRHRYHVTDPMLLQSARSPYAAAHEFSVGADYFQKFQPEYVVVGPLGRNGELYDTKFLLDHALSVNTIGNIERRYEVYHLQWQ